MRLLLSATSRLRARLHILRARGGLLSAICHGNKCLLASGGAYSPFEEFHQQADVEQASEDEEQAVPQTDAGVEGVEVEVVVVTDASDDCGARRGEKKHRFNKSTPFRITHII